MMESLIKMNEILQNLINLSLSRTTRAANMECIKFGSFYQINNKGIEQNIGEFGLHIQCPWRLTNDKGIIVGSSDLYEQIDESAEYDENFNYDIIGGNLRDYKFRKFIAESNNIVNKINADIFGGLQIGFDSDVILTIFPVTSSKADVEYWRLIDNRDATKKHYISSSQGYEIE